MSYWIAVPQRLLTGETLTFPAQRWVGHDHYLLSSPRNAEQSDKIAAKSLNVSATLNHGMVWKSGLCWNIALDGPPAGRAHVPTCIDGALHTQIVHCFGATPSPSSTINGFQLADMSDSTPTSRRLQVLQGHLTPPCQMQARSLVACMHHQCVHVESNFLNSFSNVNRAEFPISSVMGRRLHGHRLFGVHRFVRHRAGCNLPGRPLPARHSLAL